jgi:hypothetical protein
LQVRPGVPTGPDTNRGQVGESGSRTAVIEKWIAEAYPDLDKKA